jgi:hypothetical protein
MNCILNEGCFTYDKAKSHCHANVIAKLIMYPEWKEVQRFQHKCERYLAHENGIYSSSLI